MNNKKVQLIVMNAMIGAAYAVLTILISPIAYGAVQMRLTEIIVLLACYNKKFIPGLTIGCLLANLASPMGLYDICFGTAATLIACLGMYYVKNVFAGALIGGVVNVFHFPVGKCNAVNYRRCRGNQIQVVFPFQALLNDFHV